MSDSEANLAWRKVGRWITRMEKQFEQNEEQRRKLAERNAQLTQENLDLKAKLETYEKHPFDDEARMNAELELKESKELAGNE